MGRQAKRMTAEVSDAAENIEKNVEQAEEAFEEAKRRVIIHNSEGPGGKDPVPIGVNGETTIYARERECDMPESHVHVMRNAAMDVYDAELNEVRRVRRIAFTDLGPSSQNQSASAN